MTDKHEWQHIHTILKLAEMGAHRRTAKISTEYLAEKMGMPKKNTSELIDALEKVSNEPEGLSFQT